MDVGDDEGWSDLDGRIPPHVGEVKPVFSAMEALLARGHHRISFLTRSTGLTPKLTGLRRHFIETLEYHGIPTGPFNLPVLREDPDGLSQVLEGLFGMTPPTALIIGEPKLFFAVQQFLLYRGLKVPGDVSLICTDHSPDFARCRPAVAHIRWDFRELASHVLRCLRHLEKGRDDRRQKYTSAEFVEGGTVGRPPMVPVHSFRGRKDG